MDENIVFSSQVLTNAAGSIRNRNTRMKDILTEIKNLADNMGNSYRSAAAEEIIANMNNKQQVFDTYYEIIESYAKYLDTIAGSGEAVENTLTSNAQEFQDF